MRAKALLVALALTPVARAEVRLEVRPLFGDACLPRTSPGELVVTVENPTTSPLPGTITLDPAHAPPWSVRTVRAASVNVPPRSRASVRIATAAPVPGNDQLVRLVDVRGKVVATSAVSSTQGSDGILLDATPGGRFALAQRGGAPGQGLLGAYGGRIEPITIGTQYYPDDPSGMPDPAAPPGRPASCSVERNAETGELTLPRTAAGYSNVSMVLIDTVTLTALGASDLGPMADYVLSGGTLAVVVEHPSDLRHPVMAALVGPDVETFPAPAWRREQVVVWQENAERYRYGYRADYAPGSEGPLDATLTGVSSFRGGHLHARGFAALMPAVPAYAVGASADYGAGAVHLLAWNPVRAPGLDDPWSTQILQRMAAQGHARRNEEFIRRPVDTTPVPGPVRDFLTPRDGVRPALGVVTLAAVVYGLFAGPLLFLLAGRRKRRALFALPFVGLVALLGFARLADRLRRDQGRARAVTLLDVTAGMTRGALRRYVGLTSPDRRDVTLAATEPGRAMVADPQAGRGKVLLVNDRDGATLQGLALAPWVTAVVREEGYQTLAGHVALVSTQDGTIRVINRLPWALEDVVVVPPGGEEPRSFARIGPGESRRVRDGRVVRDNLGARFAAIQPTMMPLWGSAEIARVVPTSESLSTPAGEPLARWFGRAPDRAAVWNAVLAMTTVPGQPDRWTAGDPPLLVARVAVPLHPRAELQGLHIDRDEVWVRVHGYGGAP